MANPRTDPLAAVLTPNEVVSHRTTWVILLGWFVAWMAYWGLAHPAIFPSPFEVLATFPDLWTVDGLGQELLASFTVNLQALALAAAVAFPVAYLSRVPAVRPIAQAIGELRFISPAVFLLILLFAASTGHEVKVLMLALGEVFFLVSSLVGVVQAVPQAALDDCRTLRMNEWQVTYYAVIRGTLDQALDILRENAAMGWSAIMFVEGIVRSEGGVGVLILNQQKHFNLAAVYAVAGAVLAVGIAQDWALRSVRQAVCPWSFR